MRTPIIQGDCVCIPLTRGMFAYIDLTDLPLVEGSSWHASSGSRSDSFYARTTRNGRLIFLHHVLLGERVLTDHIDGDTLNNRRSNLRKCTAQENARNRRTPRTNTSGVVGVHWDSRNGKWKAKLAGRSLGYFHSLEDAKACRAAAAAAVYGDFFRDVK